MKICLELNIDFSNSNISLKIRYVRAYACERYKVYRYTLHYTVLIINQTKKKQPYINTVKKNILQMRTLITIQTFNKYTENHVLLTIHYHCYSWLRFYLHNSFTE